MTTTTATPLAVGDLVNYAGHRATVHQPTASDAESMTNYVLLRFADSEHAPHGAWQDRGYGTEGRFYWVNRSNEALARVEPETYVPQIGDRVIATKGGDRRVGTVYATQREATTDTRVEFVWVGGTAEAGWDAEYRLTSFDILREYGPSSVRTISENVPEDVRGQWYYVLQSDTVTPAPVAQEQAQEATETPEESPEVQSLRAQLSASQESVERLRDTIRAMQRDLATIGTSLKETADRQEWCGEYERHLEELLGQLSTHSDDILREHAERAQDYTVRVTYSTTVRASSESAAIEQAQEEMDGDTIVCYGDWEAEED
jgi:hypothetical protein